MKHVFVALSLLVVGCKDKPQPKPPVQGSAKDGSGSSATGSGSGTGSAVTPPKATAVTLPKGTGKPPVKTTKKLTKATLEKLSKLDYPTWNRDVRQVADNAMQVVYKTKDRPRIGVTINVQHCLDCIPMDLENWKKKEAALKQMNLSATLRDRKDTTWELGETTLNGQKLIYSYQLGSNIVPDAENENQPAGEYSDAYILYFNDGVNDIKVIAKFADDVLAGIQQMKDVAPKEDLEKVAKSYFDAYTQAWAP